MRPARGADAQAVRSDALYEVMRLVATHAPQDVSPRHPLHTKLLHVPESKLGAGNGDRSMNFH